MSSRPDKPAWLLAGALALSAWIAFGGRRPAATPQPRAMLQTHGEARPITASPAATGTVIAIVLACLVGAALYYPLVYNARAEVLAVKGTGGHAGHAGPLFVRYGCAGCHTIPGVRLARGTYGPPLTGLADRARLGGTVENTPENLVRWISRSRDLDPHAGMPNTDASQRDARDMAAYLYAR